MQLHQSFSETEFIESVIEFIENKIASATNPTIALSGGSTPQPIYKALANSKAPNVSKAHFYQIDERYVPSDHPDSNQNMIAETLLSGPSISSEHFYPFNTSLSLTDAINNYTELLKNHSLDPNQSNQTFSISLLGIGPDGHTASIFPNSPLITEEHALVAHATTDQFAIRDRLTLTFPPIMSSQTIAVLLKGKSKAPILEILTEKNVDIQSCPAKKLLEHKDLHVFFGDF